MKKYLYVICLICFVFCSCVSQLKIQKTENETHYWIIPNINDEAIAYIGDSLLKEGTSSATEAIYLKKDYGTVAITAFFDQGIYKYIGIATKTYSEGEKTITKKVKVYQYGAPMPGMTGIVYAQLLEDELGNVYYNSTTASKPLSVDDFSKKTVVENDDYYFEQQLIYTGAEGKILKFSYREFADGTARPAFTVDAVYDLSKENIIRFKGALIEVLDYNNQMIKYKLLSGFKS